MCIKLSTIYDRLSLYAKALTRDFLRIRDASSRVVCWSMHSVARMAMVYWRRSRYALAGCSTNHGRLLKLVDKPDLGSGGASRAGSSPAPPTLTSATAKAPRLTLSLGAFFFADVAPLARRWQSAASPSPVGAVHRRVLEADARRTAD